MRRYTLHGTIILLAALSLSCEEPFSPKVFNGEQLVLQCFVAAEPGKAPRLQTALLAKVYNVDGLDPMANTTDPSVLGAEVLLSVSSRIDTLREGTRKRPDSLRYGSLQHYYSRRIATPGPDDELSIVARLADGRVVAAQTVVPKARTYTSSYSFASGITTRVSLQPGVRNWTIDWSDPNEDSFGRLFFVHLTIQYTRQVGDSVSGGAIEVPMTYIRRTSGSEAVYPTYTTKTSCSFDFAAIDSAMAGISAGDPVKSAYGVNQAIWEVREYDSPLSKYFSSISGSLDEFSIRVNQSIFSNIGGGVGIFGSYFTNRAYLDIDPSYVRSFGYKYK